MGRIKNTVKYPIKAIPSIGDTVIGTNNSNNGKTVQFAVESFTGGNLSLQDNKFKYIKVGVVESQDGSLDEVANVINAFDPPVLVLADEIPIFGVLLRQDGELPLSLQIGLFNFGKGSYGIGGTNQVTTSNFFVIEKGTVTFFDPIENDPNAVVADLGEVADGDILNAVNTSPTAFVIEAGTNWYFEATVGGDRVLYGFEGDNGTYGAGNTQMVLSNLFLIYDEQAPTPAGTSSGLEKVEEGNGIGWRLIGRDPDYYGNIGLGGKDFGVNYSESSVFGATGSQSVNFSEDGIASGYGAFLGTGYLNIASNTYTSVFGYNNQSGGYTSTIFGSFNTEVTNTGFGFTAGQGNEVTGGAGFTAGIALLKGGGVGCTLVGTANKDVTSSNNGTATDAPMFIIGNGTHTTGNGVKWTAISRSNLFIGYRDGRVLAPSTTIAVIEAEATGRQLTTKEWVLGKITGSTGSTGLEALDEGNGVGYRYIGTDPTKYGNIGEGATDLSINTNVSTTTGATGQYSIATGFSNTASGVFAFSGGGGCASSGQGTFSYGQNSNATANFAFAVGVSANATGASSVAFSSATATKAGSTALGRASYSDGIDALAFGNSSLAAGDDTVAIGIRARAYAFGSTALGMNGEYDDTESKTTWVSTDRLFSIGNGIDSQVTNQSDALVMLKSGKLKLNSYGKGNFTGTPRYNIVVDSVGNLIETDITGSGFKDNGLTGTLDSSNRVFTTSASFTGKILDVYRNGLLQFLGDDYTETGADEITFSISQTPQTGDKLIARYI